MYINFQKHILYLKENRVPKATVYCIYNSATIGVIYDDLFFIKKSLDKEKYVCGCGLDLLDTEAEIFLKNLAKLGGSESLLKFLKAHIIFKEL